MGLVAVQMSINPFELFLLIAAFISGVVYALGIPTPNSVNLVLPGVAQKVWAANILLGAGLALFGGLWHRKLQRGLVMYQFGYALVGTASLVYAIALFLLFGTQATNTALTNMAFAFAVTVRVIQIQRFFSISDRLVRAHIENVRKEADDAGSG